MNEPPESLRQAPELLAQVPESPARATERAPGRAAERPAAGSECQSCLSTPARLPTRHGTFEIRAFRDQQGSEHAVIHMGDLTGSSEVVLRIHSECLTSEVFGCLRCDCRQQLDAALAQIAEAGCGLVIYLRQEGRGIGLFNKIEAYALQDGGLDTVAANNRLGFPGDCRTFEAAVEVLGSFDVRSVQLLTNNPLKIQWLSENGIEVTRRIPLHVEPTEYNDKHLQKSRQVLNHLS